MFISRTAAGSSSQDDSLPPEENSANRLVEQIQELIEFLANRYEIFGELLDCLDEPVGTLFTGCSK